MSTETGTAPQVRARDAAHTRRLLLESALLRFAHDGYGATTSRDVAADAGVTVALVNRYFGSKEGLFEACLERTVEELERPADRVVGLEDVVRGLVEEVTQPSSGQRPLQLLLLLRSSGDRRADEIRTRTMQRYTERMASIAGWSPEDPGTQHLLLRAQIAMALGFGIVVMRTSAELEPLASASVGDLGVPLGEVVRTLLRSDAGAARGD